MCIDVESASSQGVSIPASSHARSRGALTMLSWWRPESLLGANIVGVSTNNGGTPTSNTRGCLKTSTDGSFGSQLRAPDSGSRVDGNTAAFELVAAEWYLVAASWNIAGDAVKLMRDGVTVATPSQTYVNAATDNTLSAGGGIGFEENSASPYNDGKIADVAVFSRQLTDDEFATIYNSQGASMVFNGLLSWWRFTEGGPGSAVVAPKDAGPLQVNLTAVNAPVYAEREFLRRRRGL